MSGRTRQLLPAAPGWRVQFDSDDGHTSTHTLIAWALVERPDGNEEFEVVDHLGNRWDIHEVGILEPVAAAAVA